LLGFFGLMCLIGAVIPFSFHYRRSEINNHIFFYGGLFLVGLVSIIIVIAKIKSNRSLANAHKIRLSNTALEIPKGKSDLITLSYEDIVGIQLLENKFRGDILMIKSKSKSASTLYIDGKGFESANEFQKFQTVLKTKIKIPF